MNTPILNDQDNDFNTPVQCIFEGQVPTKNVKRLTVWNFLRQEIGFVVTEKVTADTDRLNTCDSCLWENLDSDDGPCYDCMGYSAWEAKEAAGVEPKIDHCLHCNDYLMGDCDGVDPENCGLDPVKFADSVFIDLERGLHLLMDNWSVAAPDCKYQSESCGCTKKGNQFEDCYFNKCPRLFSR